LVAEIIFSGMFDRFPKLSVIEAVVTGGSRLEEARRR
jgi:hypothetical protein